MLGRPCGPERTGSKSPRTQGAPRTVDKGQKNVSGRQEAPRSLRGPPPNRPGGVRWPPGLVGLPPHARGPGLGPAAARASARAAPCPVAPTAHKRSARLVGGRSFLAPPCGGPPPFLPAPRGRLRRGPCPCAAVLRGGAPAPRSAAPVRRIAPALRLRSGCRGRAPAAAPPALPLGPCAPLRGSAGARCPRCAPGSASAPGRASAALLWSPFPLLRLASALRVGPPGPPSAVRCAAPGPGGSGPRGLRGPCGPLVSASGPGALAARWAAARVRLRPLRCPLSAAAVVSVGSPLPPPRPCRPRWGLAGCARPPALGLRPAAARLPGVGASRPPGLRPLPSVVGGWFRSPVRRSPILAAASRLPLRRAAPGLDPAAWGRYPAHSREQKGANNYETYRLGEPGGSSF